MGSTGFLKPEGHGPGPQSLLLRGQPPPGLVLLEWYPPGLALLGQYSLLHRLEEL